MKWFVAAWCVLVTAGCSSVLMKEPFPDSTLTQEEREQLTGVWQIDKQTLNVAFSSNGTPWMALVDWSGDDFELQKYRLHFTKRNDVLYLSMLAEPDDEQSGYYFAEIKANDQGIIVWNPDIDTFKALIEGGSLTGTVQKDQYTTSIRLNNTSLEVLELISTNAAAFDYKNPMFLQKL